MTPTAAAYAAAIGLLIVLIAWLPQFTKRLPLTVPMICLGLGAAGGLFLPRAHLSLFYNSSISERVAEGTLILALLGAGLKVDRPFSVRRWTTTWRLLAIGMPLTIAAVAVAEWQLAGWPVATSLFLGAALVPTDPVLASAVSVGPPGSGDEGEPRFALTTEAALNDGLAYPFVSLALLLAAHSDVEPLWIVHQFLLDTLGGAALGAALGRGFSWIVFKAPAGGLSNTEYGIVAIGLAMITYPACEVIGLNGFIGVAAMAYSLHMSAPKDDFHRLMAHFTDQVEKLFTYLLLVGFGASIGAGLLSALRMSDLLVGLLLIFVIRPLIGWISLRGAPHSAVSKGLIAFFGIRGISAIYYLLYALQSGHFSGGPHIAAMVGFVVLASIVIHGVASTPLMTWADSLHRQEGRDN